MRRVPSALSIFRRRGKPEQSPQKALRSSFAATSHPLSEGAIYPVGQSYTWGGPSPVSHGFAPAIGYDGYHGGNGY